MSKLATLMLITVLVLSSLVMVGSVFAQSTAKPSVPEFTMKYVDNSYDVPPTHEIDQYTGENVITDYGRHVDNRTIEFTIKNQPFTPYEDADGNNISLYYKFRFKGPYGNDWSYYPDTSHTYGYYTGLFPDTSASNSDYTVITINALALASSRARNLEVPIGSQVQFQVQAIIGYVEVHSTGMLAGGYYGFTGERSEWSNTQTVTIGEIQTSPAPTSTPQPTRLGLALTVVVIGTGLGLLIYLIKRK